MNLEPCGCKVQFQSPVPYCKINSQDGYQGVLSTRVKPGTFWIYVDGQIWFEYAMYAWDHFLIQKEKVED